MSSICIQWRHAGAGLPGTGHRASPRCAPGSRPHPWPAGCRPARPEPSRALGALGGRSLASRERREHSNSLAQVTFVSAGLRRSRRVAAPSDETDRAGEVGGCPAPRLESQQLGDCVASPRVWPSRLRYFPAAWLRVSSGSAGLGVPGSAPAGDGTWSLTDGCDAWAQVTTVAAEVAQLFGGRP